MAKELEKIHTRRIVAMALCCVLAFSLGVVRVFQYQVVNGESFLALAQRSTETTVSVTAARGEIVDRNGVPLTQNRAAFNLELDYTRMRKKSGYKNVLDNDAANETIARLITTLENLGEEWEDELPITAEAPYVFLPEAGESDLTRLRNSLGVNSYATAQDCLYWLCQEYGIQKYKVDGRCTHCGKKFEQCDYEGYDDSMSRKIAGVRYQMLLKEFSYTDGHTRFTFAQDIAPTSVALIREQLRQYPGATVTEKPVRTYLSGDVAASLIGYMGAIPAGTYDAYREKGYPMNAIVGRTGIELAMEDVLRGTEGTMGVIQNTKGEVIQTYEIEAPQPGKTVQLTLDYYFQKELQRILADFVESHNQKLEEDPDPDILPSQSASIVVLDAKTGGALAIVSYPYYDINDNLSDLMQAENSPMFNRALQGTYRPGSSFKPIVAAGALTEGILEPDSRVTCNRVYTFYPAPFRPSCLGFHGDINVVRALEVSCNVFFYDVGRRLTIETMNEYAHTYGLAAETGLEIPNALGALTTREDENWQEGNVVQQAIGQANVAVTPLQMACEAMTLSNQGRRYAAHLVDGILSYDGKEVIEKTSTRILAENRLSDEDFAAIREGMMRVAMNQYGDYRLDDLGYPVAMKTGTPEVTKNRINSTTIGFAPADDPEIAFSILLEDTDNSTYTAKQLVRSILKTWEKAKANPGIDLSTLPPDEPEEPEQNLPSGDGWNTPDLPATPDGTEPILPPTPDLSVPPIPDGDGAGAEMGSHGLDLELGG